jgi:hypothetical protein
MTAQMVLLSFCLAAFALAIANKVIADMIADEIRTRIDGLAGVFVHLALWRLPPDQQEHYRLEYEDVVLATFYDETAGLPVTRLFKAIRLGFSLWLGAGRIRKDTKLDQQTAENDERLVIESAVTQSRRYDIVYRDHLGRLVIGEVKGSRRIGNLTFFGINHGPDPIFDVEIRPID